MIMRGIHGPVNHLKHALKKHVKIEERYRCLEF